MDFLLAVVPPAIHAVQSVAQQSTNIAITDKAMKSIDWARLVWPGAGDR